MAVATDYYELLGVSRSATEDEIKRDYRGKARELHPDTNGGDLEAEERFKQITVAYETLRDPERRRQYDLFGPDLGRGAGAGAGPGGFAGFGGDLGDLFDTFFGGSGPFARAGTRRAPGPARGPDLEVRIGLEFAEAVFGCQRDVRVRAPVACATCAGSGARPGTATTACAECGGSGEVRRVRQSILGQMVTAMPCPRCGGEGQDVTDPCADCRGEGRVMDDKVYTVDIPGGVDDGATLRLAGRGGVGRRGGAAGDLYVHLDVQAHERLRRDGIDLVDELHLSMTQAALGTHVHYETLDGTEDLVVPEGTQTGRVFRLRGRGVPHVGGRGRGDLRVHVVVDTPTDLSRAQQDLLRQLAEDRGEEVSPPDTGLRSRIRSAFR